MWPGENSKCPLRKGKKSRFFWFFDQLDCIRLNQFSKTLRIRILIDIVLNRSVDLAKWFSLFLSLSLSLEEKSSLWEQIANFKFLKKTIDDDEENEWIGLNTVGKGGLFATWAAQAW